MGAALLLDLLYPRNCVGCGDTAPEPFQYICWDCWSDVTPVSAPFCKICGDPVAGRVEHQFVCYSCSDKKPAFEQARSAVRYEGVVGKALRQLKYEKALWLVPDLEKLLFSCLKAEYSQQEFDLIIPVPLHPVHQRQRSYNQSDRLAKALGKHLKCPVKTNLLRRIFPTISQTNLTAKDRLSNVANVFKYKKGTELIGKRILLVDDVMTTGATVGACAKTLRKGGAASVHVLTVARG